MANIIKRYITALGQEHNTKLVTTKKFHTCCVIFNIKIKNTALMY